MCKIVLKNGKLSDREISLYSELRENGKGFYIFTSEGNYLVKGVDRVSVEKKYDSFNSVYLTLFHSRFRTSGDICNENTQPFLCDKFVFCHNGCISNDLLDIICHFQGVHFTPFKNKHFSDSRKLFLVLKRLKFSERIFLLEKLSKIGNRFVYIDFTENRIYLFGDFVREIDNNSIVIHNSGYGGSVIKILNYNLDLIKGEFGRQTFNWYNYVVPHNYDF